jgi:hypothetical protein
LVNGQAAIPVILTNGESELLRRTARVFSTDDMVAVSNDIVRVGQLRSEDVDQYLAELVEPVRKRLLEAATGNDGGSPPEATSEQPQAPRYVAVLPDGTDGGPQEPGIRDERDGRVLCNFVLILEEDIEIQDDILSEREFAGKLTAFGRTVPFRISAADYADNGKLKAALFQAGGCQVVIQCPMDEVRKAISTISGTVPRRALTTNFGWTADKTAYLTPSVRISQAGIERLDDKSELRVDLRSETPACNLDLKMLAPQELVRIKRHIVEDLLELNDRVVTHTLLGATAAAILYPFTSGAGRFALWLVGLTGNGKSFAAKVFSNFFGNFPLAAGSSFTNWSGTPNFVQRQGYFFNDAVYLVDDYKPEVVQPYQVVRIIQSYADNTARGRLKADATANVLRPIRGQLVCTGEDLPQHQASAMARNVVVNVRKREKNLVAGNRCKAECANYPGVTADFIYWLLKGSRPAAFVERFEELQQRYYQDVAGQQNDIRIATNLALLGAAFEQFAEYLSDVWPEWQEAAKAFVENDLIVIRGDMLGEVKEQQASEVFLRTLLDLVQFGRVRVDGTSQGNVEGKPLIGQTSSFRGTALPRGDSVPERLELSMQLSLAAVNSLLREQGKPELKATEKALLQQLREDGKLYDKDGLLITDPKVEPTFRTRVAGVGQRRMFAISREMLNGE